jgi:hypothetical protein
MYQITSFKMLFYTVLQVLFTYVYGFGPKKNLIPPDLRKWHNNPYIFAITIFGNFLRHGLRPGIHLVCVYNLFDAIWFNIKWKQGVQRLFAITSTTPKIQLTCYHVAQTKLRLNCCILHSPTCLHGVFMDSTWSPHGFIMDSRFLIDFMDSAL